MEIAFILVEPARQENIGAAARALRTMGFGDLWLVNGDIQRQAYWVAHHSGEILDRARHFSSLAEALADVDFSIATGARRRLTRDDYLTPDECHTSLAGKRSSIARAAVVFGRESSGLSSEELDLCDVASRIPMAVQQPSLNLAQAVMLYAWTLRELNQEVIGSDREAGHCSDAVSPSSPSTFRTAVQLVDEALDSLSVGPDDNVRQRVREMLGRCNDRDLGMLMLLAERLRQRL